MCADVYVDPGRLGRVYWCGDGFSYYRNKVIVQADGSTRLYLRCAKYRYLHCPGKAHIWEDGEVVTWINTADHECHADHFAHGERMLIYELLQACRDDPYQNPRVVFNRISAGYPVQVVERIRLARMRSAMRRARLQQYPNIPPSLHDLGRLLIDANFRHLTSTVDGTDNFYAGTVGQPGETSMVFMSCRFQRFLSTIRKVYCDGTFVPTPTHPFGQQVYQITTLVRNNVIPIVQVIMESRTTAAYKTMLEHLRRIAPDFRPTEVMIDFERASYRAWDDVFDYEDFKVNGCYIHFVRESRK